jgi:acyl carrier protein
MTRQEIMSRIVEIVRPYAKNESALKSVSEQTSILKDLKVNSARLVDIILAFEDEFQIGVDDEDADRVGTIGDAVRLVMEKTGAVG